MNEIEIEMPSFAEKLSEIKRRTSDRVELPLKFVWFASVRRWLIDIYSISVETLFSRGSRSAIIELRNHSELIFTETIDFVSSESHEIILPSFGQENALLYMKTAIQLGYIQEKDIVLGLFSTHLYTDRETSLSTSQIQFFELGVDEL